MIAARLVAKALSDALGGEGSWDTLALTDSLITSGVSHHGEAETERAVLRALDAVGWGESHDSVLVASILLEFGYAEEVQA